MNARKGRKRGEDGEEREGGNKSSGKERERETDDIVVRGGKKE